MSKLAKVAFSAMNGDGETSQILFEEYCAEKNITTTESSVDLEKVAKICIGVVSGEVEESSIVGVAKQFGFDLEFPNPIDAVTDALETTPENSNG